MATEIRRWNTNQPYVEFARYRLEDGREVVVKFGGLRQSWDCQSYRAPSAIVQGPRTEDVVAELTASFPHSSQLAELAE